MIRQTLDSILVYVVSTESDEIGQKLWLRMIEDELLAEKTGSVSIDRAALFIGWRRTTGH